MSSPSSLEQPEVRTGEVVAERYRLEEILGRGGFGVVFRATDLTSGRQVALKLLPTDRRTQEAIERSQREARLASRLEHENTVRLLDFGMTGAGLPYIAYELLHGRSLEALLDEVGPLTCARAMRIAEQILAALGAIHAAGIVHRDVKPENLFLLDSDGDEDRVKLLDLGLAKPVGPVELEIQKVTDQDEIIGTPCYMAPEQVCLDALTPATDLYAAGLVIAELLTGRVVVIELTPVRIMLLQASDTPVPLSEPILASPFGPVLRRATSKSVAERFQTAREMASALREAFARLEPAWHHLLLPGVIVGRLSSQGWHRPKAESIVSTEDDDLVLDEDRATTPAPMSLLPPEAAPPPRPVCREHPDRHVVAIPPSPKAAAASPVPRRSRWPLWLLALLFTLLAFAGGALFGLYVLK